jgi:hypothetical protein
MSFRVRCARDVVRHEAETLATRNRDFARSICRLGRLERAHVSGRPRRSAADRLYAVEVKGRGTEAQRSAAKFLFRWGSLRSKLGSDSSSGRSTMSGSRYSPGAIREVWQKEGKQRWDGQTHGRGLCLLIVEILQGALMPGRPRSSNRIFEFWRDQKKIRGRFIGDIVGGGVVVAKLDEDGLPV